MSCRAVSCRVVSGDVMKIAVTSCGMYVEDGLPESLFSNVCLFAGH